VYVELYSKNHSISFIFSVNVSVFSLIVFTLSMVKHFLS